MPYADPKKKAEAGRRWYVARGGYAAHMRARRAQLSDEQREAIRAKDRARKRVKRGTS